MFWFIGSANHYSAAVLITEPFQQLAEDPGSFLRGTIRTGSLTLTETVDLVYEDDGRRGLFGEAESVS